MLANWFADFIGWTLGNTNQFSVHTVDQYVYMVAMIVAGVSVLIIVSEMCALIRTIVGK